MVPGSVQIANDSPQGNHHRKKQVWENLNNGAMKDLPEQFKSPVPMVKWLKNSNAMLSLPIIFLLHPVSLTVLDKHWVMRELFLCNVET